MFLAAAHVLLRETLIVDKDGIHRGHFSSDERVNAMKDGRQIGKLQLLEEKKTFKRCFWLMIYDFHDAENADGIQS